MVCSKRAAATHKLIVICYNAVDFTLHLPTPHAGAVLQPLLQVDHGVSTEYFVRRGGGAGEAMANAALNCRV